MKPTGRMCRDASVNIEALPSECLVDQCSAKPDLDSPVAICREHGFDVFRYYLADIPDRLATFHSVETKPSKVARVYFLRRGDMIKIGWSGNPDRRATDLEADAILHTQPGTRSDEAKLHAAFGHLLIPEMGREWFRGEPDLMSFILRLKTHAA